MNNLVEGNTSNFDTLTQSQGLVLVDFWAPWCGPCKMQTPILEKIAKSDAVKVTIVKVNTDDNPTLAQKLNIASIPTLVLYKNGQEVDKIIGLQAESALVQKLKDLSV